MNYSLIYMIITQRLLCNLYITIAGVLQYCDTILALKDFSLIGDRDENIQKNAICSFLRVYLG